MYYTIVYMWVNVNGICYVHVCEQARWARSEGNSAIEYLCIITIIIIVIIIMWTQSDLPTLHCRLGSDVDTVWPPQPTL